MKWKLKCHSSTFCTMGVTSSIAIKKESPQQISEAQNRKVKQEWRFSVNRIAFESLMCFKSKRLDATIEVFIYSIALLLLRIFVALLMFYGSFSMKEKIIQIMMYKMYILHRSQNTTSVSTKSICLVFPRKWRSYLFLKVSKTLEQ